LNFDFIFVLKFENVLKLATEVEIEKKTFTEIRSFRSVAGRWPCLSRSFPE